MERSLDQKGFLARHPWVQIFLNTLVTLNKRIPRNGNLYESIELSGEL